MRKDDKDMMKNKRKGTNFFLIIIFIISIFILFFYFFYIDFFSTDKILDLNRKLNKCDSDFIDSCDRVMCKLNYKEELSEEKIASLIIIKKEYCIINYNIRGYRGNISI